MRFATVCSGIEAASVAWSPLGWTAEFFSEIEPFPSALLAHHYGASRPLHMPDPDAEGIDLLERRARAAAIKAVKSLPDVGRTPNYGDMTTFQEWPDHAIDVLAGGTPCQAFSIAGLRAGLADPRGNLALTYLAIAAKYRPRWLVWENVPGVLSSNGGADFGSILGGMVELGYGVAYRVFDAQHCRASGLPFAVPQRRRRVFVVGYFGDWRRAAAVLFDGASLRGDPPPRREAGQRTAGTLAARSGGGGRVDGGDGRHDQLIPEVMAQEVAPTLNAAFGSKLGLENQHIDSGAGMFVAEPTHRMHKGVNTTMDEGQTMVGEPVNIAIQAGAVRQNPESGPDGVGVQTDGASYTLEARPEVQMVLAPIPFDTTQLSNPNARVNPKPGDPAYPLTAESHPPAIAFHHQMGAKAEGIGASEETSITLGTKVGGGAIAFDHLAGGKTGFAIDDEVAGALRVSGNATGHQSVLQLWKVRRLTPRECERLMGMPDDYTLVPFRGKPAADGPRYKGLGNSWPINVPRTIGERMDMIDKL